MTTIVLALLLGMAGVRAQPADSILQKAIAEHQAGHLDAAVSGYRAYLKTGPDNVNVRSNLGAALAKLGRYAEAIEEYKAGLKLDPSHTGISLNLALAYYKMGDIRDASRELSTLRALTPDNMQATLLLADCYLQMGENDKVIDLLSPIQKDHQADLGLAYMLGTALVRDKRDQEGQKILDPIFKRGDSAETRLLIGTAKLNAADFAGAMEDLGKAVQMNPNLPSANAYFGQSLMATGDTAGAAKAFRQELKLNPNDFNSNLNLAVILKQDQNWPEALQYLGRALKVRPGDLRVRYQLGTIYLSQGKLPEALQELEATVKEAPQFTEAHVSLATVYYRLKRKADGDRERAIVQKLNAEAQARQPKGEAEAERKNP